MTHGCSKSEKELENAANQVSSLSDQPNYQRVFGDGKNTGQTSVSGKQKSTNTENKSKTPENKEEPGKQKKKPEIKQNVTKVSVSML